jgi:NTP pyrophosphatase (non-canonical NTP hydrolase)
MDLNEWAARIYDNSVKHGFYDEPRTFDRACMLIASEVHEAHEEFRDGRGLNEIYYNKENPDKPEGVPIELADAIIRLLDTCHDIGIDVESVVALKHKYNVPVVVRVILPL